MKVVTAPEFAPMSAEIIKAVSADYPVEKRFCDNRNVVDLVDIAGRKYVVKRYKKPIFFNALIYTFFRKTKARRGFENADRLLREGISTPKPVAYIEKSKFGIFRDGYFISEFCPLPTLEKEFYHGIFMEDFGERDLICEDLSLFVLQVLRKGLQPLDFNTSNIMYEKVGGHYRFTLIDLNRMRFKKRFSLKESMESFAQIGTYTYDYNRLLVPYCRATGDVLETAIFYVIKSRRHRQWLKNFTRGLKNIFRFRKETPQTSS